MIRDVVTRTRTCRRFKQEVPVRKPVLKELVDLARLSASGGNLQPLKYHLSNDRKKNAVIFDHLAWAGYLDDWPGPPEGERPPAYIMVLCDKAVAASPGCDHGIAAQSIMLGATEQGLRGCIFGSIRRKALHQALGLDKNLDILLVLAIGKAKETATIEPVGSDGNIKYWRDADSVHHVPKRRLRDIIVD